MVALSVVTDLGWCLLLLLDDLLHKWRNEGKEGGGRRKRIKENLLNIFFRSKNQRIFGGTEIRWLCKGALQVRIFLLLFLFLDLTFNLDKIRNKKTFRGTGEMLWGVGRSPRYFNSLFLATGEYTVGFFFPQSLFMT